MAKIEMKTALVDMNGDEMTRVLWSQIRRQLIEPFVALQTEDFDLGMEARDASDDEITRQAALRTLELGVAVKCATITPNAERVREFGLKKMWPSPNATIRAMLDGTVFRAPILMRGIEPLIPRWTRPITIARHAYGDVYKAVEAKAAAAARADLVLVAPDGSETRQVIHQFSDGAGIVQAMHNTDSSIDAFAHSCFSYALETGQDLWFATKDTISKTYDHHFKDRFAAIYEADYARRFEEAGIEYFYTLIDDAVARIVRSSGGMIWACKNYDGDVMSDMVATVYGSLSMMSSVLVSPRGAWEYEAAHGTVTRHFRRWQAGEDVSTNPIASIFAWSGALRKRGELDGTSDLVAFADALEAATRETVENGEMTGDLAAATSLPNARTLSSTAFIAAIRDRLARRFA
ncbi:MAG: NADP-dependent isocitrate dehydrogenase [Bacillota bacterium]|nr:NADP-dependent isocitrate dehydrogenase [Bacillota bacterium]